MLHYTAYGKMQNINYKNIHNRTIERMGDTKSELVSSLHISGSLKANKMMTADGRVIDFTKSNDEIKELGDSVGLLKETNKKLIDDSKARMVTKTELSDLNTNYNLINNKINKINEFYGKNNETDRVKSELEEIKKGSISNQQLTDLESQFTQLSNQSKLPHFIAGTENEKIRIGKFGHEGMAGIGHAYPSDSTTHQKEEMVNVDNRNITETALDCGIDISDVENYTNDTESNNKNSILENISQKMNLSTYGPQVQICMQSAINKMTSNMNNTDRNSNDSNAMHNYALLQNNDGQTLINSSNNKPLKKGPLWYQKDGINIKLETIRNKKILMVTLDKITVAM